MEDAKRHVLVGTAHTDAFERRPPVKRSRLRNLDGLSLPRDPTSIRIRDGEYYRLKAENPHWTYEDIAAKTGGGSPSTVRMGILRHAARIEKGEVQAPNTVLKPWLPATTPEYAGRTTNVSSGEDW